MRKKIFIIILLNVLFSYTEIPDLVTKVATTAGNWLKLETGARAVGMGGAQVAAASGISAISYNPASIAYIDKNQTYFSHTLLYADISHSTFAYGTKLTNTDFFGLSLFYVSSGEILKTDAYHPDGDGTFSVTGLCFRSSYAKILTDRLKVGVSVKYIREKIWEADMQTFAVDIGSNFKTGIYGMILGMSVSNFGPEVSFNGDALNVPVADTLSVDGELARLTNSFPIPMTFRVGVSKEILIDEANKLVLAIDGINPVDYTVHVNVGGEYSWRDLAYLRLGSHLLHDTASFTVGGGVKMNNIHVDYALASYGILDFTHQFGIRFGF